MPNMPVEDKVVADESNQTSTSENGHGDQPVCQSAAPDAAEKERAQKDEEKDKDIVVSKFNGSGSETPLPLTNDISEGSSSVTHPVECDIGQIDEKIIPNSLREPPEMNGREEDCDQDGWMDVIGSGDLLKKIIRKGNGIATRPQRGSVVTVNISGKLENDDKVEMEQRQKIFVGDAEVIQGLELAIPLMELEEISEIKVKPRLAYGKLGREPDIPPNATITYQVELMAVEDEPDLEDLSIAERQKIGNVKREKGNFWYSRGEYSSALQCYRRALDFLDDSSTNFSNATEEQQHMAETWLKVSNNMAAAQLKIGAYEAALKSVENVLKVQPKNVKALFRKGKIQAAMGSVSEAVKTMKEALALEPETKIIHQELSNLVAKQKSEVKIERDLYRRMLGQDKQQRSNQKTSSGANILKWGIMAGSLTVAVLGIVVYRHFQGGMY